MAFWGRGFTTPVSYPLPRALFGSPTNSLTPQSELSWNQFVVETLEWGTGSQRLLQGRDFSNSLCSLRKVSMGVWEDNGVVSDVGNDTDN